MAHVLDDGTVGLTDEDWEIEKWQMRHMAFGIFRDGMSGKDPDGAPFEIGRKDIDEAFGLLSDGLDWPETDYAGARERFYQAVDNANAHNRAVLLRKAYRNLVELLGFEPNLQVETVETFPLQD